MTRNGYALFALLTTLGAFGCDDGDDDDGGDLGTAPALSALSFDPDSIPLGEPTVVTGRVTFVDPEGDVDTLHVRLTIGATVQVVDPIDIMGVDGIETGEVLFQLVLQPPVAMPLAVDVWLVDLAGHESEQLSGQIAVTSE
jgi:hypothetical protein